MRVIPVDTTRLKVLVVGEPTPQIRNGQPVLDRNTNEALWNLDVTVIGEARAETVQLSLPEGSPLRDRRRRCRRASGHGGGHLGKERPLGRDGPGEVDQGRRRPGRHEGGGCVMPAQASFET